MAKEKIIFDLDDVLIKDAFFGVVKEFCKEHLGKEISKESLGENYYYEEEVFESKENKEKFFDYFLKKDMYDYGILEDGAVELLEELSKTYDVFIFTAAILKSRSNESAILFKNKYEALCKTFPFIPPENFIIGGNKSIASADYMIDDKVENLTGNINLKMLYTARHNLNLKDKELVRKGVIRVSSMEEVRKIIKKDFTLEEILNLANKYIKCFRNFETAICTVVQGTVCINGDVKFSLDIKVTLKKESGFKIKNDDLEPFRIFISKIIGDTSINLRD